MRVKGEKKKGKNVGIYLTLTVYKLWRESFSAKDLSLYMAPSENLKTQVKYEKGDFVLSTFRMPLHWVDWYRNLTRDEKFAFAKIIENRLREAGII